MEKIITSESGQGLAEYSLILSLILLVAIVAISALGGNINAFLSKVGSEWP